MKNLAVPFILITLFLLSCHHEVKNTDTSATSITTRDSSLPSLVEKAVPENTRGNSTILPIHGRLDKEKIDRYYPKVLDTVKTRKVIGSDPIGIKVDGNIIVSLLHNAGTSDQMFLCTHNKDFDLLDTYYIGKSTLFDKTSHTIEYKIISKDKIEFHHTDWGSMKRMWGYDIDTTN